MPRGERPLELGDGPVVRFARDLRRLREQAGAPAYRELSVRAHYSAAALSEAASGRKLPTLSVTVAYVTACGGDAAEWEARWRVTAAELAATKADAPDEDNGDRPPYVGLAAFQREDSGRFFGREKLVADLVSRLRQRRFLGVLGASGCGKSSVLRAGLIARLAEEREDGGVPIVVFTPGRHPIEECAVRLAGFLEVSPAALRAEFSADPWNLHLRVRQVVVECAAESDVVLVVDQFEELFTLCGDEEERATFIDMLVMAASDSSSRARVVLGIRADFLGQCGEHPGLVDALRDAQVLVGAMTTDELRLAVTGPAEQAGYRMETALVARVVADAARQPGMLPLVSHALLRTWQRRRGAMMTLAAYDAVGGIEHALARSAEEVFQALDTNQQGVARQVFVRLTALGEGTEDTKRRITRGELDQEDPNVAEVVDKLARARLITLGHNSVEIAHEALIRHWPRLRGWLADDREGHRIRRQLTEAAIEWEHHGRDDGLLYRGTRLAVWLDRPFDQLTSPELVFLDTSRRAAAREHRTRRRRVWWTIGGLSSTTVVFTVLAVIALMMGARANDERELAVSRQLIADARAQLQVDPELGLLLAREAYARMPNEDTEAVLRQATADSHVRATVPAYGGVGFAVTGAAFSSDGKHLVTSDTGGALQVWDWDAGQVVRTKPQVVRVGNSLHSPVFSSTGDHIAAISSRGVVVVRDWASGGKPARLVGSVGPEMNVVFSPDGQRIAASDTGSGIWVWNVDAVDQPIELHGNDRSNAMVFSSDGKQLTSNEGDINRVWDLAGGGSRVAPLEELDASRAVFRPDGQQMATARVDGAVWVSDLTRETGSMVLGSHDGHVSNVTYSADGHWIASSGDDRTIRIWNANHRAAPAVLHGKHGRIVALALSPEGRTVVSTHENGPAKVWEVGEVDELTVLHGLWEPLRAVAASPDGSRVAIGYTDGTVRMLDVRDDTAPVAMPAQPMAGKTWGVNYIKFSPDGRHVATSDLDVHIWNTREPTKPSLTIDTTSAHPAQVAFSPDGELVAVVDGRDYVAIWNVNGNGSPDLLSVPHSRGETGLLATVAWSADGQHIAAATRDGKVLLWNPRTRGEPRLLRGSTTPNEIAFSPNEEQLASAGDDDAIHLWNVSGTADPIVFHGHQGRVWSVTFSSDSRLLLSTGNDATIRAWNTRNTKNPLELNGFRTSIEAVMSFGDDRYVSAHGDGTIRIWRCPACGPITEVAAAADKHVTRDLTSQERQTYLLTNP